MGCKVHSMAIDIVHNSYGTQCGAETSLIWGSCIHPPARSVDLQPSVTLTQRLYSFQRLLPCGGAHNESLPTTEACHLETPREVYPYISGSGLPY